MSRFGKLLAWIGGGLLALVVVLLTLLIVVINSETALRWAWGTAQDYLPEGVQIANIKGRLVGPLVVEGVTIDNEAMRLTLERARLEWQAWDLLNRTVHLELLAVRGLDYTAKPGAEPEPEAPAEPFEMPEAIDLPVDVLIDSVEVKGVAVRSAPDAEPFVVDTAKLQARLNDQGWVIETLSASGPLFAVDGGAELSPRGHYATTVKLDWQLTLPDVAPVNGETRLAGDLAEMRLTQTVAAPYNLQAKARVSDLLGALAIDAELGLQDANLAAIRGDLPPVTLNAEARAEGGLDDLAFQLSARAAEPEAGTAVLDLDGRFTGDAVRIGQLQLTSPDTPARLRAEGTVALAQGNPMDLRLRWQDLQWPLAGQAQYASPQGAFRLSGPLDDYHLDGGLRWRLAGQDEEGRLQLVGDGDLESLQLAELALSGAPGQLNGRAHIVWAPRLKLEAQLDGENVNPGAVAPTWPGDFSLRLAASAEQQDDGLHAQLQRLAADGSLRGQSLEVAAQARYGPGGAFVEQLKLRHGATQLQAQGQIAQELAFRFTLNAEDLGTTLPGAAGKIRSEGRATGSLSQPRVQVSLNGSGLRYQGNRLERLSLEVDVDISGNQASHLRLTAEKGGAGTVALHSLTLTGDGRPGDHRLQLTADASEGRASLALTGALNEARDAWAFTLREAELTYQQFAPWQLSGPATGRVSTQSQRLESACWTSGEARLCLEGSNGAEGTRGTVRLDKLAFAYFKPLLPPEVTIEGALSGRVRATLPAAATPTIQARLRTTDGAILTRNDETQKAVPVLTFAPGEIHLSMADGMEAEVALPLAGNGRIALEAGVPGGQAPLTQRPLSGQLDLRIADIGFLAEISPEITKSQGEISGHYTFSGSLAEPAIDGRLALQATALNLATPGLQLKEMSLALIGRGREVGIELRASSGGGRLAADGNAALTKGGATIDLQINGDRFQIVNTAEARAYVSPDLAVAVTPERINVEGTVKVPEADITPRNLPEAGGVTVSDDQVIVRPEQEEAPGEVADRRLHARVRVIIGDPNLRLGESARRGRNYDDVVRRLPGDLVRFEGFGMRAVLVGNLLINQDPGQPATGSGTLRIVVGQYRAYGQELTIEDGKVLFGGGPVSKPALDIRAVRRPAEDILVGVQVRGRLEEPEFTLFSDPSAMTQSEQLSWLVLGRPLSGTSSSESSLMTRAAMALGLQGGNALAQSLGSRIGVDELTVEGQETPSGTEQAALQVGKYLTPNLYVSYSIGLFEPVSTVRMRYSLTKHLQLETQSSGTASGGDIIYTIELGD